MSFAISRAVAVLLLGTVTTGAEDGEVEPVGPALASEDLTKASCLMIGGVAAPNRGSEHWSLLALRSSLARRGGQQDSDEAAALAGSTKEKRATGGKALASFKARAWARSEKAAKTSFQKTQIAQRRDARRSRSSSSRGKNAEAGAAAAAVQRSTKAETETKLRMRSTAALALGARFTAWRKKAEDAKEDFDMASDAFAKFIADSKNSNDACSSRLLQAGNTLKHIAHRAKTLTEEMEAHQKTIETETQNLNATEEAIHAAQSYKSEQQDICEKDTQEAQLRFTKYEAELKELQQIANPEVMAVIAAAAESPAEEETLLETSSSVVHASGKLATAPPKSEKEQKPWTTKQCEDFVSWSKKSSLKKEPTTTNPQLLQVVLRQDPANETDTAVPTVEEEEKIDCANLKGSLQEKFLDAYTEIMHLVEISKEEASVGTKNTCMSLAEDEYGTEMLALGPQQAVATNKIEESSAAVSGLTPVVESLLSNEKKLEQHVSVLQVECVETSAVSTYLTMVRQLIVETSKCPGIQSYQLDVPMDPCKPLEGSLIDFTANLACKEKFGGDAHAKFPDRKWEDLTGDYWMDVRSLTHSGSQGGAFIFSENRGKLVQPNFRIDPRSAPMLSMSLWVQLLYEGDAGMTWVMGCDDGGYDRSIILADGRFGGRVIASGIGRTYQSQLSTPNPSQMFHVVYVWDHDQITMYLNGGTLAGGSQEQKTANNGGCESHITLGGLENFGNHGGTTEIFRLSAWRAVKTPEEVKALYESTRPKNFVVQQEDRDAMNVHR